MYGWHASRVEQQTHTGMMHRKQAVLTTYAVISLTDDRCASF